MPNATVRANAQTLSASHPPDDDRPQSSRRGFLRILARIAPAVGLAAAPALAAPLDDGPAEDPVLLALCVRLRETRREFGLAADAFGAAREAFYNQWGPIPEAIRIKGGDVVLVEGPDKLRFMSAARLRKIASTQPAKSQEGRRARRQLKIAEAYEARRKAAMEASGWQAASDRLLAAKEDMNLAFDERTDFIDSYGLRQEEARS